MLALLGSRTAGVAVGLAALILAAAGAVLRADQPDDWSKGPAGLLMTGDERDQWKRLQTDEQRSSFIDHFWAVRDPDPTSRDNEFRSEFERRLELVNREFKERAREGWRTLRGQVYLTFGPPQRIEPRLVGGMRGQVWHYNDLPRPLDPNFGLVFADVYRDGRYYLLPQFGFGQSRFERQSSLFELNNLTYSLPSDTARAIDEVNKRAVVRQEAPISEGVRVTKEAGTAIPYEIASRTRPGAEGKIALDLKVTFLIRDLALREVPEGYRAPVLVTAALRSRSGETVAQTEARMTVVVPHAQLEAAAGEPPRELLMTLEAPAGSYTLEVELRDEELSSAGSHVRTLQIEL